MALDREGLYSLTPELVALEIAHLVPGPALGRVLDGFCGLGGNAIGFARCGRRVLSVDMHSKRLAMARHNATQYGVASKITFVCQDLLQLLEPKDFDRGTHKTYGHFDALFLDPPWGGPGYDRLRLYRFQDFSPCGLLLLDRAAACGLPIAFRLPRNFDLNELQALASSFTLQRLCVGQRHNSNLVCVALREGVAARIARTLRALYAGLLSDVRRKREHLLLTHALAPAARSSPSTPTLDGSVISGSLAIGSEDVEGQGGEVERDGEEEGDGKKVEQLAENDEAIDEDMDEDAIVAGASRLARRVTLLAAQNCGGPGLP